MSDQVKGIGDEAPQGWALEESSVPMPKGLSKIMDTVREIFSMWKIHSLRMEVGKPISFTRFVKEEEAARTKQLEEEGAFCLGDLVRNVTMEEYEIGEGKRVTSREMFIDMLLGIAARRLHLTHIGLGPESLFFKWMDIDHLAYGGMTHFAGAEIVRDKQVPPDVLLILGSMAKNSRLEDTTFVLKGHMHILDLEEEDA